MLSLKKELSKYWIIWRKMVASNPLQEFLRLRGKISDEDEVKLDNEKLAALNRSFEKIDKLTAQQLQEIGSHANINDPIQVKDHLKEGLLIGTQFDVSPKPPYPGASEMRHLEQRMLVIKAQDEDLTNSQILTQIRDTEPSKLKAVEYQEWIDKHQLATQVEGRLDTLVPENNTQAAVVKEETDDKKAGMTGAITDTGNALEVDDINTLKDKMVNGPDSETSSSKASKDEGDEKASTFDMRDFIPKGDSKGMVDNWMSAMTSFLSFLATMLEIIMIEAEKASKEASQKTSPVADTSMPGTMEGVHDEPEPKPEAEEYEYEGLASLEEVREQMAGPEEEAPAQAEQITLSPPNNSASYNAAANYCTTAYGNTVDVEAKMAAGRQSIKPTSDNPTADLDNDEQQAASLSSAN